MRVRVRKKVHGERTEAMLEKKKNWSVFMVLRLPNPRRNKGAGVIPVALCLTYGGQVIVSLVTQDFGQCLLTGVLVCICLSVGVAVCLVSRVCALVVCV